jgi:hypothetical protein
VIVMLRGRNRQQPLVYVGVTSVTDDRDHVLIRRDGEILAMHNKGDIDHLYREPEQ